MKQKIGRPTKMTPMTVNKLEQAFSYGCTDIEACLYAGISKQTLYNYQDKNPEFVDRKEALKETPILLARKTVVEALKDDPALALKFLERKRRDEFSLHNKGYLSSSDSIIDIKFTVETPEEKQIRLAREKKLAEEQGLIGHDP
jgi:hypothetical protein